MMMRRQNPQTKSSTRRGKRKSFKIYDNCRFAVLLWGVRRQPLKGLARFQRDDRLGNILRIAIEDDCPGDPEIVVSEKEFNGLITEDVRHGCDYCLFLTAEA